MKIKLIFLIIIIAHSTIYSQTSFKKLLSKNNMLIGLSVLEDSVGDFIIAGTAKDIGDTTHSYLLKIDKDGNFIKDTILLNSYGLIIKYFNNNYYAIGANSFCGDTVFAFYYPPYNTKIYYYKLDLNFNIINHKVLNYKQDKWIWKLDFTIDSDTNLLIIGSEAEHDPSLEDPFFYKISESGDSIKCKIFESSFSGRPDAILEKPDKTGYYAFIDRFINSYVISSAQILELNKDLDSLSCRPIPNNITQFFSALYLNDSTFIISGDERGNYTRIRAQTVSVNSTGNSIIDYSGFGTNGLYNIVPRTKSLSRNNDNIYLCGETRHQLSSIVLGSDSTYYYIVKLNDDLTPIWEKRIGGDALYSVSDLYATNDGGCIFAGTRHDHTVQTNDEVDIYVVKLTSDGTIAWEKEIIVNNKVSVYPNPGTDYININSDVEYSNFSLFDLNSKIVISDNTGAKTINTSSLKQGIYIYKITDAKGNTLKTGKWVKR